MKLASCKLCGAEFRKKGHSSYCGKSCAKKAKNAQSNAYQRPPIVQKVCAQCGSEFVGRDNRRVYCSDTCLSASLVTRSRAGYQAMRAANPEMYVTLAACQQCGTEFRKIGKSLHCSVACADKGEKEYKKAHRPPTDMWRLVACITCGVEFNQRSVQYVHCSKACKRTTKRARDTQAYKDRCAAKPKVARPLIACKQCGVDFQQRTARNSCCSAACAAGAKIATTKKFQQQKIFKGPKREFCKCGCGLVLAGAYRPGIDYLMGHAPEVRAAISATVGSSQRRKAAAGELPMQKDYDVRAKASATLKRKHAEDPVFHAAMIASGNHPSPSLETREKLSRSLKAHYRKDPAARSRRQTKSVYGMSKYPTKPEVILHSALASYGFDHVGCLHPKDLGLPISADILSTTHKIIVLVDGCYWHGCPTHCKVDRVKKRQRDAEKRAYARSLGWAVVEIWEHDIVVRRDKPAPGLDAVVRHVVSYIATSPRRVPQP